VFFVNQRNFSLIKKIELAQAGLADGSCRVKNSAGVSIADVAFGNIFPVSFAMGVFFSKLFLFLASRVIWMRPV
jgi:hypothetical protein